MPALLALFVIAALLAPLGVQAAPSARPSPKPVEARPLPSQEPLPLTTRILPNGLQVAILENHAVPLVTIEVAVHNGSMNEPLPLNGLSHLYEHMFFKGNARIPNQEAYMARLRQMGADWNGTTGTERVNYFFTLGSTHTLEGLAFMADAIKSPRFDPAELKRERQVVLGEFDRNEASPGYHLQRAVDRALWYRYPTYKDPLGTRASIQAATVEQMKWMQKTYYVPNNSLLILAGDVRAAEVLPAVERLFGDWRRAPDPFTKYPLVNHPPLPTSQLVFVRQDVQNSTITLNWQGPDTEHDWKGAVAADVFSFALNQQGSRLQKALVDSGLATSVSLQYQTLRNTGQVSLALETPPEKTIAALQAALREVASFGDPDYVTPEQWSSAQTMLAVNDLYDREKTSEFTHTLSYFWSVAGLAAYEQYIPMVRAARLADGAAYARRYLVGRPLVVGVMASPEAEKKHGVTQGELHRVMRIMTSTARPRFAVAGTSVTPPEQRVPNVESFEVDGIPVLFRRNPATSVVAASVYFKGGSANTRPDVAGIEDLALNTAVNGGTRSMRREERAARVDALGAVLSVDCQADYSSASLKCVKGFFAPAWDLFTSGLLEPAFSEADVDLFRRRQLADIHAEREEPDQEVRRIAELFFFQGHPYQNRPLGTTESLGRLKTPDVRDYFSRLATRSKMLVVVVGDVDRAQLEAAIHGSLGRLPQGTAQAAAVPVLGPRPSALQVQERKLPTTYVRALFAAPALGEPDYAAVRLATAILSHRLFEEIRTKRNLTYAVYSGLAQRRSNYGVLYISTTQPDDAVRLMLEQVRLMADEPLSPEALREQTELFLTNYYEGLETSEAQAGSLGHAQVVSGDWRNQERFLSEVRAVTPQKLQEAVKRYFRGFHWAVLGAPAHLDRALFTR